MMICPKCKAEYLDGFLKCSDCGENLIAYHGSVTEDKQISDKGIKIIRYGLSLLFLTIFEVITVIIIYDFFWVYKLSHGGVSGTALSNVNQIVWLLIIFEFIISFITIYWGANRKENSNINKV